MVTGGMDSGGTVMAVRALAELAAGATTPFVEASAAGGNGIGAGRSVDGVKRIAGSGSLLSPEERHWTGKEPAIARGTASRDAGGAGGAIPGFMGTAFLFDCEAFRFAISNFPPYD